MLITYAFIFCLAGICFGVIKLCNPALMERFHARFGPESLRGNRSEYRWSNRIVGLLIVVFCSAAIIWMLEKILSH
jgi:hypothetical protein